MNLPSTKSKSVVFPKFSAGEMAKHTKKMTLTCDYWILGNHVIVAFNMITPENKQMWLWKPSYLADIIRTTLHHHAEFVSIEATSIRDKPFKNNEAKKTKGKNNTNWDVQCLLLILKVPEKPTLEDAANLVDGWAKYLKDMGCHDQFNAFYKATATNYTTDPQAMPPLIKKRKDAIHSCFEDSIIKLNRHMNLDHTFMDDTIQEIMNTCYSHAAVNQWDDDAKVFAFQNGRPEERFH